MGGYRTQRGFLLIVAVILIAVAGTMAAVIMTLVAGSGEAGAKHANSTQSFFAAESGIERALYGLLQEATSCSALSYNGSITVGSETATYATSGTLYLPAVTSLSTAINATTTIIPVASIAGYALHGRITVGSEAITYTGTSTSAATCGTAPCFVGATRGVDGTTAVAAAAGTGVVQSQCLIRSVGALNDTQRTIERAVSTGGSGAMVTYVHENNLGVPYYRLWNNTEWGAEGTASNVGSEIRYMVVKAARTRREYILVTQTANGQIRAQIFDGTSWSNGVTVGATRLLGTVGNAGDRDFRAFDVEYETAGDRAVVVYRNNNNSDPDYQIWNGTNWSATATITANNTAGRPRWIELAAHPGATSNELALMVLNHNDDIDGTVWNGAAWSNMGLGVVFDATTASSSTKVFDVAYESGGAQRAMFVWLDSISCTANYRLWNGTNLSGAATFTGWNGCNTDGLWMRAAADPFSDDIMVVIQEVDDSETNTNETPPPNRDTNNDLASCFWNGAAWDCAHPAHAYDPESPDGNSRIFDIAFSTDPARPGEAWLMWGALAGGGTNIWRKSWTTGVGWEAAPTVVNGPDACLPQLLGHPNTGIMFAAIYEDTNTDAISSGYYRSGVWSTQQALWSGNTLDCQGPGGATSVRVHERVAVAAERTGPTPYDWTEIFP
jgi:hypothetical protein